MYISSMNVLSLVGVHSIKATILFPYFSYYYFLHIEFFYVEDFSDGLPTFYNCMYLNYFRIFTPLKKTHKIQLSEWLSYSETQGTQPRVIRIILSKRFMLGCLNRLWDSNKQTNDESKNNLKAVGKYTPAHNIFWRLCHQGHVIPIAVTEDPLPPPDKGDILKST